MKNTRYTLLFFIGSFGSLHAQNKHNLFVDVNVLHNIGLSATYNRKVINHLDLGVGANAVYLYPQASKTLRSGAYIDIRPYWGKNKHMWFVKLDPGIAYFSPIKKSTTEIRPLGIYFALAYGYQYRMNSRGIGPYVTLGWNGYYIRSYSSNVNVPEYLRKTAYFDAEGMFCIGFKF
ncbi:MAG: hypothetical protein KF744_01675 [Taibaiella sp.]|nr:hypothetical protein [Taibaiella sp.]